MTTFSIPFNRLAFAKGEDEAFKRVVERRQFILGQEVAGFEWEFAKSQAVDKDGVGIANCTDALEMVLSLYRSDPRYDEIITVANAGYPTVSAILNAGFHPKFVDIGPDGLMDPEKLPEILTETVRAIIPVHLYGRICNMPKIHRVASEYGIPVIEDAAQAAGSLAEWNFCDYSEAACFSFYPTKNLGAFGDGGMILSKSDFVLESCRLMRNYGVNKNKRRVRAGRNSRLDEMQAAILRVRLKELDRWNNERNRVAKQYHSKLRPELLYRKYNCWDNQHLFTIRVKNRIGVMAALAKHGIETAIHYDTPAYRWADRGFIPLPATESHCDEVLSLPMYPDLLPSQIDKVCQAVNEAAA